MPKVFGPGSPEAAEVASNPGQAFADFVGIAIHCAQGEALCSSANHGRPDLLPDEPGGYSGFNALFGNKYVAPQISNGPMKDLFGNVIQDSAGHVGFPGFDGVFPRVTLSYVAAMQEHGVPITFGYISDAHDKHGVSGEIHKSYGPGEAGYVQQLHDYDTAFAEFFARLERDGITKDNTLFVVTTEEEDHFVGGTPANPGCDGVNDAVPVDTRQLPADDRRRLHAQRHGGERQPARAARDPEEQHDAVPGAFGHGARLLPRQQSCPDAAVTRTFERDVAGLSGVNPITGATDQLSDKLVDRVGMDALHMITGDPLRTPTFIDFLDPNYFGFRGAANCASPCVTAPGDWSNRAARSPGTTAVTRTTS